MSGQRVGVVGDAELAGPVETAGGAPVVGDAAGLDLAELRLVVAAGEAALVDVARRLAGTADGPPVLPVGVDEGVRAVPRDGAGAAVRRVLRGDVDLQRHPVVSVRGAAAEVPMLLDVALMAAEPARISEFSVRYDGGTIARFRADGVVVSTPAGSPGYNRAADGPMLAPGTDVVSVVPVAPFTTDAGRWVLPAEDVTVAVERDETPVELLVDGRAERVVAAGQPVTLSHGGAIRTVVVPESSDFF
jgi:NAD+ kinase